MGLAGVMLNSCLLIQLFPAPPRASVFEGRTNRPTRVFGLRVTAVAMRPLKNWRRRTFLMEYLAPMALAAWFPFFMSSANRLVKGTFAFGQFDIGLLNQILKKSCGDGLFGDGAFHAHGVHGLDLVQVCALPVVGFAVDGPEVFLGDASVSHGEVVYVPPDFVLNLWGKA